MDIEAMGLLSRTTGAEARDVVLSDASVVFVVKIGDLGKAIGKQGSNIHKLERMFGKEVTVVEEAQSLGGFVSNLFSPARIVETREAGSGVKKTLLVKVEPSSKGAAIGTGGSKIKRARLLLKRHYGFEEVRII